MTERQILTIAEVADYLRVSERTVYEWAQKGEIPCGKLGMSWRFKRSEIESWINRRLGKQKLPEVPPSISIADALTPARCTVLASATKVQVLKEMVRLLASASEVRDREDLEKAIFRREQLMSTGIGLGIGLPHARLHSVENAVMGVGLARRPIADYDSLDNEPVRIVVMVAAGRDQHAEHIRLLSQISARLRDDGVRESLVRTSSPDHLYRTLVGS